MTPISIDNARTALSLIAYTLPEAALAQARGTAGRVAILAPAALAHATIDAIGARRPVLLAGVTPMGEGVLGPIPDRVTEFRTALRALLRATIAAIDALVPEGAVGSLVPV
jgi:hypothetical protein